MVKRPVRRTLLIVCEGKRDAAFLLHLRKLYCADHADRPKVTVKSARGKGGNNVFDTLYGEKRHKDFDVGVAFTEADEPPKLAYQTKLNTDRWARWIVADPCLEGLLLSILGRPVPASTDECKRAIENLIRNNLFEADHYDPHWPLARLEDARRRLAHLDALIRSYEGR